MNYLVELVWDRTTEGQMSREVKVAAIPHAGPDNVVCVGDQSFGIRSVAIVVNPKSGKPVAHIRLRGSLE